MHRMTPNWTWILNRQKYSIYTKYLTRGPNCGPFRSTTSRFRDTRSSKIGNPPSDSKLNLTTYSKKYPIYNTYLPLRSKFWSVSHYDQRFPRYRTFYNFIRFALTPAGGELQAILRTCTKWPPNDFKTIHGQRYPIFLLLVSTSPNFHPFRSNTSCCWVTGHFGKNAQSNDLKLYTDKCTPYMCYQYPRLPNFTPFCCTTSHWLTCHFLEKCTEWPKIDLEPYKVKSTYICITSVPDSQISLRLAVRPAIVEIHAILKQVHWMIPKWPWTLQGQRYPIFVLLLSTSPIFLSVLL